MEVEADAGGVSVHSTEPTSRVEITEMDGTPVASRRFPSAVLDASARAPLLPDRDYRVTLQGPRGRRELVVHTPASTDGLDLSVAAPFGEEPRPVDEGDVVEFGAIEGLGTIVSIRVGASGPGEVRIRTCNSEVTLRASAAGERLEYNLEAASGSDCPVVVRAAGRPERAFVLRPFTSSLEQARAALRIDRVVFPADALGEPDAGRSADRITLPSPLWETVLRRTPLGVRARAVESPWSMLAVHVVNDSERPLNAVVRLAIDSVDGDGAPAFRPRLRLFDGDTGQVTALLRVLPADRSVALLPVFVDDALLPPGSSEWVRTLELTPLGAGTALLSTTEPLYVSRGSTATTLGLLLGLLSTLVGVVIALRRIGPWLRATPTSELVTIALFANLMFFFSAASHLVGLGVATVLGPFSSLVTGLVDDAFRYTLLATLVTLLPRPGVVTLAIVVHYLMRGLALGGFNVADPVLLGSAILWLEGGLWVAGITRGTGWRDERRWRRWLRMSAAFATAAVVEGALGLVIAAVLYRLYFAQWYVVLILAVPGFLYTVVACWLATGFAATLRRVEG